MDFFEHQAHARRMTRRMLVLFLLSVAGVVLALNMLAAGLWVYMAADGGSTGAIRALNGGGNAVYPVPGALILWVTLGTLGLIGVASLWQILQLAQGGHAVAQMFGARWVRRETQEATERRLLNVVDEMAIASGITAPHVYVLDDEAGINAFAAGYSPNQAVIAVTRGALQTLNRDELQGVIAHEFSHVLNGDMRLNIRMIGLLHGILVIGLIGRFLMRAGSEGRGKESGGIAVLGFALFAIGYVGVLFGNLIKAAVSRQREFLADASAVQFTRNPDGIGSALLSIGRHAQGATVDNAHAEELSHMFFGEALASSWAGLFDTHPPLEERVKRLFGGRVPAHLPLRRSTAPEVPAAAAPTAAAGAGAAPVAALSAVAGVMGSAGVAADAPALYASIGAPAAGHIEYARRWLDRLPETVNQALSSTEGAQALLYALLLSLDAAQASTLLAELGRLEPVAARVSAASVLLEPVSKLDRGARLPLAELAIPQLATLPLAEREALLGRCRRLIEADRKLSLDEFVYFTLLEAQLGPRAGRLPERTLHDFSHAAASASIWLGLLAHAGHTQPDAARTAYQTGSSTLGLAALPALPERAKLRLDGVRNALHQLHSLNPQHKARLVKAALAVVLHDQQVRPAELDLMRASCAALDVPLPPVLALN
jgi:Zn-dependent protease with chaperone function